MKLCQIHKKYDPELKINMPMKYNSNHYSKDNAKKCFPLCENTGIVKHFPTPFSFTFIIRRIIFSLKLHYPKYWLLRSEIRHVKAKNLTMPGIIWYLYSY